MGDFFVGASRAAEEALVFPARLIPRWKSPSWGLRYLLHYWRLVADPSSWLYLAVAGAISGYVATYFVFRFLPFRSYTEPLIVENLLAALGFTTYRVFVPLLASLLIAARCGAAVASDVGAKVYGQQWDALRTLNAPPPRYLATNIHYAFLSGILLLVAIAFYTAKQTSLVVFVSTHPDFGPFYWDTHFHHELRSPGSFFYRGTGWLVAKLLASAAGIGAIAYCRGARPKHSSTDVSLGITSTVLMGDALRADRASSGLRWWSFEGRRVSYQPEAPAREPLVRLPRSRVGLVLRKTNAQSTRQISAARRKFASSRKAASRTS